MIGLWQIVISRCTASFAANYGHGAQIRARCAKNKIKNLHSNKIPVILECVHTYS